MTAKKRYLTLVAVLALDDDWSRENGLHALAKLWGIQWRSEYQRHPERFISMLARHAIEYHREQDRINDDTDTR